MDEASKKDPPALTPQEVRSSFLRLEEHQRLTARAITDLARGLAGGERRAGARHGELLGIVLASIPGAHVAGLPVGGSEALEPLDPRERRDSSVRIRLPQGITIELPRRKIWGLSVTVLKVAWYIGVAALVGLHWLIEHFGALAHR